MTPYAFQMHANSMVLELTVVSHHLTNLTCLLPCCQKQASGLLLWSHRTCKVLPCRAAPVHHRILQCNCNPSGTPSSVSHSCPMAYARHVVHAHAMYCITPLLAGLLSGVCGVQIVMTVTTAVLCYAATPRTPQEHVAASTVSSASIHCVQLETSTS